MSNIFSLKDTLGKSKEEEEEEQQYFAGGEKSGILLNSKNPQKNSIVDEIIAIAKTTPFSSSSKASSSSSKASSSSSEATKDTKDNNIEKCLTFWRNGFSIDNGQLLNYSDPENIEFLNAIKNGIAPMKFFNVNPGENVSIKVSHQLDSDFKPPAQSTIAYFSGQGNRLGSFMPAGAIISSQQPTNSPFILTVDPELPTTAIQVRLADGSRMVIKCNHSHTLADLYSCVSSNTPREFILQSMHPLQKLENSKTTIVDAGLLNSVVIQKII